MFNNSSNLYGSEWLAVVFNNRNKNYGAYTLRAQSDNNTMKALFIAAPLFIMLFVGPVIYGKLHKQVASPIIIEHTVDIAPDPIHEMKKEQPKKEAAAKELPPAQPKAKSLNFSSHVVVVPETTIDPPTSEEVAEAVIASTTQEGIGGVINATVPTTASNGGGGTAKEGSTAENNEIYIGVDVYPEFPGGMAAWSKFIQKNLRYPSPAQEEGIQGKVFLSFVVEKDGSITDVKVIKGIGYGCDDEAKRVILKSPKWNAGKQNNQTVRVRYNMPINYVMSN